MSDTMNVLQLGIAKVARPTEQLTPDELRQLSQEHIAGLDTISTMPQDTTKDAELRMHAYFNLCTDLTRKANAMIAAREE